MTIKTDLELLAEYQARQSILDKKYELRQLDMTIPRGLEDDWAARDFDTATLPQATQDKLARKIVLRAEIAELQ